MILNKCAKEGCNPLEQTRGQMKPEDHHEQHRRYGAAQTFSEDFGVALPLADFRQDAYEVEDAGRNNAHDFRISCSKCGKATGWDRRDIEEFKRYGDADYRREILVRDGNMDTVRERWNELVK